MKATLKRLRYTQPLNRITTAAVRSVSRIFGRTPEWAPRHLHRIGEVRERLPNGTDLILHGRGDDWVTNLVYWNGWRGYEPGTIDLFYRLATRSSVILDVGAYVGFFTLVAGHANPRGRLFAFEPMPAIFARLEENVRRNRLANVECVNAAVGREDGRARFFFSQEALETGLPTSSSLSASFMAYPAGLAETEVPLLSLDTFLRARSVDRVDLIKIDTESTEPEVLSGFASTLARDRPAIICEVLKDRVDVEALDAILRPCGYHFFLLSPEGPRPATSIEGHPEFLNYLFTARPDVDLG